MPHVLHDLKFEISDRRDFPLLWLLSPLRSGLVSITAQQFQQMQQRLNGSKRVATPVFEPGPQRADNVPQIILGIDPSLRSTGYGVVKTARPHPVALAHGRIQCPPAWDRSRCLVRIVQEIREVIKSHHPARCVVEGLFYAQNLQTALLMGEARGASLVAVAEAGLPIYELAPRKVKQAIAGYGAAHKLAVAKMVQRLLRLSEPPQADAADALAVALAYALETNRYSLTVPKKI